MSLHGEYPKKQTFYKRLVAVLARARRAGLVPWDDIRDDGDTIDAPLGYANAASLKQALMWRAEGYARHRQEGQACHIMVACEAAGMVPQLSRICHDYGVTVRSSGGMDSVTVKRNLGVEIATRIVECQQPTILLHIGDWDPTGISIYTQIYHDVGAFISGHLRERYDIQMPYGYYRAERIALTQEHVDAMDPSLLGKVKKRKKREYDEDSEEDESKWYAGINGDTRRTCEVEALPPTELRDIVEHQIRSRIDPVVRRHVLDLEAEERDRLKRQIGKLRLGRHGREASITPELARKVKEMRTLAFSIREIAATLGLSKSAVARVV